MLKYRTCRGNEIQNVMLGMLKRNAFSSARIQRNWYIFKNNFCVILLFLKEASSMHLDWPAWNIFFEIYVVVEWPNLKANQGYL